MASDLSTTLSPRMSVEATGGLAGPLLRPAISRSRFFSLMSAFSSTPTSRPSRSTVARSLMRVISAMRCVTMITAEPLSRNSRIFANRRSVESKSKAAEDSSRISTFGWHNSARPIVIHCLMLNGSPPTMTSRSRSKPVSSAINVLAALILAPVERFFDQSRSAPT